MSGTSRVPSLLEVEALKNEQLSAAREGRDPKWSNIGDVMAENIPEENFIWGSKGQRLETKEGRYTTKGHSAKTDEALDMQDVVEGSPNVPQATWDEAQASEKEYLEAQAKYDQDRRESGLYDDRQHVPQLELVEQPRNQTFEEDHSPNVDEDTGDFTPDTDDDE